MLALFYYIIWAQSRLTTSLFQTATPPFGKTPLKHGAKVEIVSLGSSKVGSMLEWNIFDCHNFSAEVLLN